PPPPPPDISSAASDVYKRQAYVKSAGFACTRRKKAVVMTAFSILTCIIYDAASWIIR
ncbi:hypothetical protein H8955_18680, partial [Bacillus pumilus]|nr:hypothetical protein [Bacillus pumilus]